MADPENPDQTPAAEKSADSEQGGGSSSGGDIGLNMQYITSIPGILKIVEFFTLMLAFAIAGDAYQGWTKGEMDFFLFVTVTSWLLVMAVFVLFAFNIVSKINLSINWNIPLLIFAVAVAFLLLLSSALLADFIAPAKSFRTSLLDKLRAAVAFGFISMFVFIGDAVVIFLNITGRMSTNAQFR